MAVTKPSSTYRVYLLSVWQEHSQDATPMCAWRFRLEDPHSGEQRGFANAEELVAALRAGLQIGSGHEERLREAEKGE